MSRVTIREWYRRVSATWPANVPAITNDEALVAARKLFRFALGRRAPEARIVTGNRVTWVENGILIVNPKRRRHGCDVEDAGWKDVVHLLSHYCHRQLSNERPHGGEHARLEMRMIREVLKRGWLSGSLHKAAAPVAPERSKEEKRAIEQAELHARLLSRLRRWETKQKRATTAIKKLTRALRRLERAEVASAPTTRTIQ